jgi:hypothetical protein
MWVVREACAARLWHRHCEQRGCCCHQRGACCPPHHAPGLEDIKALPYVRQTLAESLRLYPQPPLLIRRALAPDTLPPGLNGDPAGYPIGAGVCVCVCVLCVLCVCVLLGCAIACWRTHAWVCDKHAGVQAARRHAVVAIACVKPHTRVPHPHPSDIRHACTAFVPRASCVAALPPPPHTHTTTTTTPHHTTQQAPTCSSACGTCTTAPTCGRTPRPSGPSALRRCLSTPTLATSGQVRARVLCAVCGAAACVEVGRARARVRGLRAACG